MNALVVAGAVVVVVVVAIILVYNALVGRRNAVDQGWHLVDIELARRHDLVPNLVSVVQGYATHEQATFERVTAARTAALAASDDAAAREPAERALVGGLRELFAVAEAYPDLQAGAQFLALQGELSDVEDRIAVARRIYNANVRAYNDAIQQFPGALFASGGRFVAARFFEVDPVLRSGPPPSVAPPS